MMIGESNDIQKLIEYHNLMTDLDEAWRDLEREAEAFIDFVEAKLPTSSVHWARRIFKDMAPQEAIDELMSHVMFEGDRRPSAYARRAAINIEEKTTVAAPEESALWTSLTALMEAEKAVLDAREDYIEVMQEQEKVRRRGDWELFVEIQRVQNVMGSLDGGTPIRVDECQAFLSRDDIVRRDEVIADASESLADTTVERLESLERRVVKEESSLAWSGGLEGSDEFDKTNAVVWAAYLSLLMDRGEDKSGSPFYLEVDTGAQIVGAHPTTVLQN